MQRLGVFGGTFDPVHTGHLTVAAAAGECLDLDEVLFIPAGRPRLKDRDISTAAHHRLCMVQLATAASPLFTCSDMEIRRCGPTYTADTLEQLNEERGGCCSVFLIAGLDALGKFHMWGTRRGHTGESYDRGCPPAGPRAARPGSLRTRGARRCRQSRDAHEPDGRHKQHRGQGARPAAPAYRPSRPRDCQPVHTGQQALHGDGGSRMTEGPSTAVADRDP